MFRTAAVTVILLSVAVSAGAQAKPTPPPRPAQPSPTRPRPTQQPVTKVYISINGAFQTAGDDFGQTVTFTRYAEQGTFTTDYQVESGPALNVSGGVNLFRYFGVGVGVTRYSKNSPIGFTASVPHPFFFNRARSVTADITDLKREELAVHVQARATFAP